jgi:hypothetical protein
MSDLPSRLRMFVCEFRARDLWRSLTSPHRVAGVPYGRVLKECAAPGCTVECGGSSLQARLLRRSKLELRRLGLNGGGRMQNGRGQA